MSKLFPAPYLSLFLLLIWLLLFNSIAAGVVLLGIIFSLLIPIVFRNAWPAFARVKKPHLAAVYFCILLFDIIVANFKVAALILGRRKSIKPALLVYPLNMTEELPVTILASTITLTPGTVSCEITRGRKGILIHAFSEDDPEQVINTIRNRYERRLKEIFEC
ncbi:Na+/H+ antiporter subunit E [Idiomarina sp. OT37-5b]|jgi:multicomponent K+:H+ antiporter subunit E|uniref:Na+/H+ antiporter subunit E n=1 Tax=Idiomarina aquatica TaxID=1327752 RepID=A0AA94JCD2_9GAMM|nr:MULTISPECIES: Na+/H+ antiporter subunit E [Idiomarina]AVJ56503.1 Na+/H+ antiporter subunit E [Idiomarina sp. OT37-5b]RUO39738.1 Na+/H+ antiporter subunit E [Idiomarina aquatica]